MKQKLLLLAMGLFAAMGTIKADNVFFKVDKVDVMQGKTAKVTMCYNADGTNQYMGAQVEFIMPDGLTVTGWEMSEAVACCSSWGCRVGHDLATEQTKSA